MSQTTVRVEQVSRVYETTQGILRRRKQRHEALREVSLEVAAGEIFGLIGPNGAGKTTLIKILTTLLTPTSGQAQVLGYDVARQPQLIRPHINFIFGGERGLYGRLSGEDNLHYFADLYRVERKLAVTRCQELLQMVGLWEQRGERVEGYSKGMKQRLHVAKSLVNAPKVLFLDEPTIGLDPVAARALREVILEVRRQQTTVFLTSHYMWEMELLSDRIAVLKDGQIVTTGAPNTLKQLVGSREVVELQLFGGATQLQEHLQPLPQVDSVVVTTSGQVQTLRIQTQDAQSTIAAIRQISPQVDLTRLFVRPANLEDVYFKLVGGDA
jgi:ABC-2 type transport system ATP-binding protein